MYGSSQPRQGNRICFPSSGDWSLLVIIGAAVRKWLTDQPLRRIWDVILGEAESKKLYIVMPSVDMGRLQVADREVWTHVPKNISLVPLPEAVAVSQLVGRFREVYRQLEVEICSPESFANYDCTFVSVGGPSVNSVTRDLVKEHGIDWSLHIQLPAHVIRDVHHRREYSATEVGDEVVEDVGFSLVVKNPLYPTRMCAICMGIWAHGTGAAIRVLLGECHRQPLFAQMTRYLRSRTGMLIVSKVRVQHLFLGHPQLVRVRELRIVT